MKKNLLICQLLLLFVYNCKSQTSPYAAPNLGIAANFVLFTITGAVSNTGVSMIKGNIGTNAGAISNFDTANVTGSVYNADSITVECSIDLLAAYNQLNNTVPTSTSHTPAFGSGETLFAGVYSIAAAGSVAGELTLDAQGDPNAVFIFKIGGAFTTGASTTINLINGASACNVFWKAEGAISMAASTIMKGTLIANNGAISMGANGSLEGRMFSTTGAAYVYAVSASIPTCFLGASWTGAISTDWHVAGNWLDGTVPTIITNIIIPPGLTNYPILNADTGSVQNIVIQTNASLTVTNAILQISGSISNSGTFDLSDGTIEMNGSSAQTIPANTFANNNILNLTIGNDITLAGQQNLTGTLSFESSNKTLFTGGFLTLQSTATGTARLADITNEGQDSGNNISGNVTVERYIPAKRAWHILTAPITNSNTIYNSWQNGGVYTPGEGTLITMPTPVAGSGMDSGINANYSMMYFNPSSQGLVDITNTMARNISPTNNGSADNAGYYIFIRGDRDPATVGNPNTVPVNSTTLSSSGVLQTGYQAFTASSVAGKFTLIGNPYASPIDFNYVTLNNVIKRFYVWDPTLNEVGAYVLLDDITNSGIFTSSIPGSAQGKDIQSGEAFFVQTLSIGPASLSFNENSKSSVNNNLVFRHASETEGLSITLNLLNTDSSTIPADGTVAQFNNTFSDTFNFYDARKFANINEGLALIKDGIKLALERRPFLNFNDTLFLSLTNTTKRSYQFITTPQNWSQPGVAGFLSDDYLGTMVPLSLTENTIINFSVDSNIASQAANRFQIIFRPSGIVPVTFTAIKAFQQYNNITVDWDVSNQLNTKKYLVEKSTNGSNFTQVASIAATGNVSAGITYNWIDTHPMAGNNYYRILNIGNNGATQYSQVVKVNIGADNAGITVYPNPITDETIGIQFNNMPGGQYNIRLLNPLGKTMLIKDINYAGGSATEKITLSKGIVKGIYNLEITNPDNSKTTIGVVSP
jgi:hypothetical protein